MSPQDCEDDETECPGGCCSEEGWACCEDGEYCAETLDDCPDFIGRSSALRKAPKVGGLRACDDDETECPGGCCSEEGWACCEDGEYCAETLDDCPDFIGRSNPNDAPSHRNPRSVQRPRYYRRPPPSSDPSSSPSSPAETAALDCSGETCDEDGSEWCCPDDSYECCEDSPNYCAADEDDCPDDD